jgi:hypothetical protein
MAAQRDPHLSGRTALITGALLFPLVLTTFPAFVLLTVVPLQVGAPTVAFPRAASAAFWAYLLGGGLVIGGYAIDGGPFGADPDGVGIFAVPAVMKQAMQKEAAASRSADVTVSMKPLPLSAEQVAGYIAKYATKATEDAGGVEETGVRKINVRDFSLATRSTPREVNRQILLNLVREHQPISRADLARKLNVGRGVVTSLVAELLRRLGVTQKAFERKLLVLSLAVLAPMVTSVVAAVALKMASRSEPGPRSSPLVTSMDGAFAACPGVALRDSYQ